jgi:hypothetical protein
MLRAARFGITKNLSKANEILRSLFGALLCAKWLNSKEPMRHCRTICTRHLQPARPFVYGPP